MLKDNKNTNTKDIYPLNNNLSGGHYDSEKGLKYRREEIKNCNIDSIAIPINNFIFIRFEEPIIEEPPAEITAGQQSRIKEAIFYPLFASWLKNELEEVSHAISLGGNVFRDRWGTPDVLGKLESRRSDVIKGPTLIVSAEVKIDVAGLLIGFGQACAFKLFSHKSYLVIPSHAPSEEVARVDSLCQMFGIGLVTFNSKNPISPDFQLLARAIKHEPDLFYTNRYLATVEKELFS